MLNITTGTIRRAQKIVIYGCEGIGKTTLASKFPDPLFIDTEGGSGHLDVRRLQRPNTFSELVELVREVADNRGICKTLVIDTADWAETMCIDEVCETYKKKSIEDFGYGKGYTYLMESFAKLLAACDTVIAMGANVVITAHAKMRKFEQPDELGAYDRWEMKLTRNVAPIVKEWADLLLFCNYKTYVTKSDDGTAKASGGKRVMCTTHHPCWDAKNRHGLPEEIPMDFSQIAYIFDDSTKEDEVERAKVLAQVGDLMRESGFTDHELKSVVACKGFFKYGVDILDYPTDFYTDWVIPNWNNIVDYWKNTLEPSTKSNSEKE